MRVRGKTGTRQTRVPDKVWRQNPTYPPRNAFLTTGYPGTRFLPGTGYPAIFLQFFS